MIKIEITRRIMIGKRPVIQVLFRARQVGFTGVWVSSTGERECSRKEGGGGIEILL